MPETSATATDARNTEAAKFSELLKQHGLLIPAGSAGVYLRGPIFGQVIEAVFALVGRLAPPDTAIMDLPPIMDRRAFLATGYLANFPNLCGMVHCFCGDDDGHSRMLQAVAAERDWCSALAPSDVVLTPASCYPVYGIVAQRGPLPADGLLVEATSWCFRHEPSSSPIRMLSFRQREQVCFGTEAHVGAFEDRWKTRAMDMFAALKLPAIYAPAQDPFFGRLGRLMAQDQQARGLKHEILVPIVDPNHPDPCGSFNHHGDHFARAFGLRTAHNEVARTACAGFGLERLALALFRHHGFQPEAWPYDVRDILWPRR